MSGFKNSVSQAGNGNIFVLRGVIYVQHFQIKSRFSKKKKHGGTRTHFPRKLIKFNMAKYKKKNSIVGRSWNSAKLFVLKNDTAIADRDVENIRRLYQFTHQSHSLIKMLQTVTPTHKRVLKTHTDSKMYSKMSQLPKAALNSNTQPYPPINLL